MIELLTRIALFGKKSVGAESALSLRSAHKIVTLLRLMDASSGKAKLLTANRHSVSVRKFVYITSTGGESTGAGGADGAGRRSHASAALSEST